MRRVWATVVGVWATIAIVGVFAWSHVRTPVPSVGATPTLVVVKGANGKQHLVVVQSATATHATTQTSPAPPA